ncbi:MAG: YdcF family protein [Salaquimonas sp.]
MFIISKLIGFVIHPINTTLILIFLAAVLWKVGWKRSGNFALTVGTLYLAIVVYTPLSSWLILPLEQRFERPTLPSKIDGIIVLGGGIEANVSLGRNIVEHKDASDRLYEAILLARQFPEAKIIYTGGSGKILGEKTNSSDFAKIIFLRAGLDPSRITLDPLAKNTYENALNSKSLMKPALNENWILVTSAFHMPRSMGLFRALDWEVIPWPVDYYTAGPEARSDFSDDEISNLVKVRLTLKEWVGMASYYFMGKSSELFPGP